MNTQELARRTLMKQGSAALAALALLRFPQLAEAFPSQPGEVVLPWLDQPPPAPFPGVQLKWEALNSWLTPNDQFFTVEHYNIPAIAEPDWRLELSGLVAQPLTLTLADLRARPRQEVVFTLECSGNHGFPFFIGGISTARWAGTPLAPLLQEAGLLERGSEVVFWGADAGDEEREAQGAPVSPLTLPQHFARSMALDDALAPSNLLCYEMNGAPLPQAHGFPLRLIAPGWYGVANVKWLTRIEVRDTRLMNRFMARDYVTIRQEQRANGETVWTETSVGRMRLKSVPAKVTRAGGTGGPYRIVGAAWGAPIARVEVQIDGGPWQPATVDRSEEAYDAWRLWSLGWGAPASGEHTITSRAIDTQGHVQPARDDPWITGKQTYWESNGQVTRRIGLP